MSLIIDGYNLLNAVGITGRGHGSSLERSRRALLNFLAESLAPAELAEMTVVFDAAGAPPWLPRVVEHRGISVRFAAGYPDADTLIRELVEGDTVPRRMTVVSSDHALRRAARRRKARAVDSDVWFREVLAQRARRRAVPVSPARPQLPLSEAEVANWLEQFGGQEALEELIAGREAPPGEPSERPVRHEAGPPKPPPDKLTPDEAAEIGNPFPPGYGEDLLDAQSPDDPLQENPFPPGYGEDE